MINLFSPKRLSGVLSRALSLGMAIFITAAVSPTRAAESIGVSVPTLDNVFWVRAVNFAKHTADTLGIELVVVGAENKEEKQLNDVQSLISRGVKALVITPQSTASAPGLIRLANRSNIPILIVDRYPGFPATGGHWLQLGFGVMIAYDALHGQAPIKDDIRLSLIGVDSENFAKFKQQYIDNPPPFEVKDYMLTFNPKTTRQTFPLSVQ